MNLTFLQYKAFCKKNFNEQYPDADVLFSACHPDKQLLIDWYNEIFDYARAGGMLRAEVLDDIAVRLDGAIKKLRHDWPNSLPTKGKCTFRGTYLTPSERR